MNKKMKMIKLDIAEECVRARASEKEINKTNSLFSSLKIHWMAWLEKKVSNDATISVTYFSISHILCAYAIEVDSEECNIIQ